MNIHDGRRFQKRLEAAQGYLMLELPDRALSELEKVASQGASSYDFHILTGEALRMKKWFPEALVSFRAAHQIKESDLAALMGMAWCFKRIDQLEQSIEMMRLAYESHKEVPVVLYNLACYYSLAGDKEQALSWLGRALRMDRGLIKLIPDETDFDPMRHDPDFVHLLELTSV